MSDSKTCTCPVCNRELNLADGLSGDERIIDGVIKLYKELQAKRECPNCPRCGRDRMARRNALSRQFDIDVCPECRTDEAVRAASGDAMPVSEWWIVREI